MIKTFPSGQRFRCPAWCEVAHKDYSAGQSTMMHVCHETWPAENAVVIVRGMSWRAPHQKRRRELWLMIKTGLIGPSCVFTTDAAHLIARTVRRCVEHDAMPAEIAGVNECASLVVARSPRGLTLCLLHFDADGVPAEVTVADLRPDVASSLADGIDRITDTVSGG